MSKSRKSRKSKQRKRPAPAAPVANPTTERSPAQAQGNGNLILVAGVGAALLLFWYYHLITLNQMTDLSNGLMMPDQMIGGYSVEHVEALRNAMDADAVGQLNYLHKTAGLLFPLFFALATMLAVNLHTSRGPLRWALWLVPAAFTIIDLWENRAIDALLTGPFDPAAVEFASTLTNTRWILFFAAAAILVGVLVASFVRTFRQKWEASKHGLL